MLLHDGLFWLAYRLGHEFRLRSDKPQPVGDVREHLSAFLQGVGQLTLKELNKTKVLGGASSIETALSVSDLVAQRLQFHPLEFAHS